MQSCPKCGSPRVRRSRSRGWFETLRKGFTHNRLHRCHACGWRGWGPESDHHRHGERSAGSERLVPDLSAIDEAIDLERQDARKSTE